MRPRLSPAATRRGFTLVELMVVVTIVAILATIGSYGVSKYIASSKTGEAVQMIGAIKAAQESFKDETFRYLDVSGNHTLGNYYPVNDKPGQQKVQWGAGTGVPSDNWRMLGVSPTGPVLFVYACAAGTVGDAFPGPGAGITIGNWPGSQTAPWYVIRAHADLDAGGEQSVFIGTSFTTQLFSANEGQ